MASVNPSADFDGWLPIRLALGDAGWRVDWCWFGAQRLTRPAFRDDVDVALRLPFNQGLRRDTDVQALLDWQARSPGLAPGVLLFHASRCGSTLLAQMLAGLERNAVLAEAPPLDHLLRAHLRDPRAATWQPHAVEALLSAYGQRRGGEVRQLVVKLDAWNVFDAPLLSALYPETPRLFLYRDPLEIVVSRLRQPALHRVAGAFGPSVLDRLLPDAQGMSALEFNCRMIGEILRAGVELCRDHGGIAVNYCELPGAVWGRLASDLGVTPEDVARLEAIAVFDAKQPGAPFTANTQRKREQADEEVQAAVRRWAWEPYAALEAIRLSRA